MLLDSAITPVMVRCSVPWSVWSCVVWPARVSVGGTVTLVVGLALPSSTTADRVSSLPVDPGS